MAGSRNKLGQQQRYILSKRFIEGYATLGGTWPIKVPNHPVDRSEGRYVVLSWQVGASGEGTFFNRRNRTPIFLFAQIFSSQLVGTQAALGEADIIADIWRDQTYTVIDNSDRLAPRAVVGSPVDGLTFVNQVVTSRIRLNEPSEPLIVGDDQAGGPWHQINVSCEGYTETKFGVLKPDEGSAVIAEADGAFILSEQGGKILFE